MQIAQIASLTEAIPPKLYGGTERVISWLADELVALGHEVVLFASGDGEVAARVDRWHAKARIGYAFPRPQGKSDLATASVTCAGSPYRI